MRFRTIVADPPWKDSFKVGLYGFGSSAGHYHQMTTPEICSMGIQALAGKDSMLWLWTKDEHLRNGDAVSVCRAWGFRDVAIWPWIKLLKVPFNLDRKKDRERFNDYSSRGEVVHFGNEMHGMAWPNGFYGRVVTEYMVVGVRGSTVKCMRGGRKAEMFRMRRVTVAPIRGHSEKPDEAFAAIERAGLAPRLELFARRPRSGWSVWGDEVNSNVEVTL